MTGVEGTIYEFPDCPEQCYAPHPSALTGCHLLPREKALACANHQSLPPLIRLCFAKPPSPRGRLFFASLGGFQEVKDHTPSGTFGATSPYTPGGYFSKKIYPLLRTIGHSLRHADRRATSLYEGGKAIPVRRMEFERAGHAAAPTHKIESASRRKCISKNHPVSKNFEAGWCFFLREIRIFFTSWTGKRRWRQRPSCLRPWPE